MEVTRQHVLDTLQRAGYGNDVEKVISSLPDPVDLDDLGDILRPYGITKTELVSRMGGSP